mgnify:FL=1
MKTAAPFEKALRKRWGPCLFTTRIWCNGLFSAIALYGAAIWMGELYKTSIIDMTDTSERVALYSCLPVCRTISTDAMQVISGEIPWRFKSIELGLDTDLRDRLVLIQDKLSTRSEQIRGKNIR